MLRTVENVCLVRLSHPDFAVHETVRAKGAESIFAQAVLGARHGGKHPADYVLLSAPGVKQLSTAT